MNDESCAAIADICAAFADQRLPRWRELPDLELYMDQVLSIVSRALGAYPGFNGKGLTAAMVNNYVKQGVIPSPVKKKYSRSHLAHLIIVCVLKSSLPIPVIQKLLASELETAPEQVIYDRFCELFEQADTAAASAANKLLDREELQAAPLSAVYLAALRAQAEQALALKMFASLFPETDKKD